eukprot:3762879-Rhodomonas_salina.2
MDFHEGPPLDAPNLKSCFASPEHTHFVDSIISEYCVTGVTNWYPLTSKPVAICPLGVVPKLSFPFFRLVIDARGPNATTLKWASNLQSLAASAHIFELGSVCFSLDIRKAYVVSPYQGCRRAFTTWVQADCFKFQHIGCEPDNCNLACSRENLGFRWRGQTFVFAAPMFGGRVSCNIWDTLYQPVDRWVRSKGILMLRWVDDLILAVSPLPEYRHDST